jgi:Leucine-rich repeat (LRR) protein
MQGISKIFFASTLLRPRSAGVANETHQRERKKTDLSQHPGVSARTPELPVEVWGKIVARVPLPPPGSKSIGDLKSLRLVCRSMNAEVTHAHQEVVDRAASGLAREFLRNPGFSLTVEDENLLRSARSLDLSCLGSECNFGDRLEKILEQTAQLRSLNLRSNYIGAAGARDLPIGQLVGLQALDLSFNKIGAADARELRRVLPQIL